SNFNDIGHAPVLNLWSFSINDPNGNNNGKLEPGETAELIISIINIGSADALSVNGELIPASTYISLDESTLYYGNIDSGDSLVQTYIVTADESTPEGFMADFNFHMTADSGIAFNDEFNIIIGQIPVLILDFDGNNNSANEIQTCLENLGVSAEYATTIPENMNLYASTFVCLGVYPDNYSLIAEEGDVLAAYLNDGGMLYMEGSDTWAYDSETAVHPMFNIDGLNDGSGDMTTVIGQDGSICAGMDYTYSGDNNYMDHIAALNTAELFFENEDPVYGCAVSNDAGAYKTIGMSLEFGGLDDGDLTKDDLMAVFLDFFGIESIVTTINELDGNTVLQVNDHYPNPFSSHINISFELSETTHVTLEVYNLSGQRIETVIGKEMRAGKHIVQWGNENISGHDLPEGIYFYRIITSSGLETRKMVKMQ
ncbi:MAG: T9SS type A sorting domain-containing protein, partial [Bacteroidota bacterium]|nr:T9SS type A sorting domain-containing protein [Bacteroidota bacterium]